MTFVWCGVPNPEHPEQLCGRLQHHAHEHSWEEIPHFIVAEISKTWHREDVQPAEGWIARLFEQVIEVNLCRGYRLLTFQLDRCVINADELNETIVAVFERTR